METIHAESTPLAAFLEGDGYLDPDETDERDHDETPTCLEDEKDVKSSFAPSNDVGHRPKLRSHTSLPPIQTRSKPPSSISQLHNAWSTAVNSRLGRADNERFMEHFRYIIVASQLLNEYLDQGSLQQAALPSYGLDGTNDTPALSNITINIYGVVATAAFAFALVYFIHWSRSSRSGLVSKGRVALVLDVFALVAFVGYTYLRRQWLKLLRQEAVTAVSSLTASWQAFEVTSSSALSFIQEVQLVSKGYRLSTPLPPVSRIEDQGGPRRCTRFRKALHKSYSAVIPACTEACQTLRGLIDEDDLEKYFEIYDINGQDAKEASGDVTLGVLEDDAESLKSLRVFNYRAGVLRRVVLCYLMALEADGGKPDFHRWRLAVQTISTLNAVTSTSASKLRQILTETETLHIPPTPLKTNATHDPGHGKMRAQARKISMLSTGIRGLQAKMQILHEETNKSISASESDLTDVRPDLMTQYDSIGADLRDLMQAWESGKASLQISLVKQERRISMASNATSGLRSPFSSISGLTAVSESGTPADALKALNGDCFSNRSSMATSPSDDSGEQVFEAVAMPKQRSSLTREERILRVQEERERQAMARQKRESNTHMLRELESVINLRPKARDGNAPARITSI